MKSLKLAEATKTGVKGGSSGGLGIDIPLLLYFALWYLGNYYVSKEITFYPVLKVQYFLIDFYNSFKMIFVPSSITSPTSLP